MILVSNYRAAVGKLSVLADRDQISLVLRNLIDNAIKFTPKNGEISFSLKNSNNEVEICVIDTVAAIAKINIEQLRSPQLTEASYGIADEKGVGLGLHLCREYVAANGGLLDTRVVANKIVFCFKLPLSQRLY